MNTGTTDPGDSKSSEPTSNKRQKKTSTEDESTEDDWYKRKRFLNKYEFVKNAPAGKGVIWLVCSDDGSQIRLFTEDRVPTAPTGPLIQRYVHPTVTFNNKNIDLTTLMSNDVTLEQCYTNYENYNEDRYLMALLREQGDIDKGLREEMHSMLRPGTTAESVGFLKREGGRSGYSKFYIIFESDLISHPDSLSYKNQIQNMFTQNALKLDHTKIQSILKIDPHDKDLLPWWIKYTPTREDSKNPNTMKPEKWEVRKDYHEVHDDKGMVTWEVAKNKLETYINNIFQKAKSGEKKSVSYTHLTLPTKA